MSTPSTTTVAQAAAATAAAADAATQAVSAAAVAATTAALNAADNSVTTGSKSSTNSTPKAGAVSTLMNNITNYQYNPASIQGAILQTLTDVSGGTIDIVDPSNPFVFCLEAAAVCTASFMMKNEANTRKQYPFTAQTQEDLYLHMSDIDYIDRFATPAKTTFSLLLPLNEVLNKMILDQNTGIKQLIIPRNSYITIASVPFSIQYPIVIQQMQHGGLQIVYDTTVTSPLQQLTSNIIPYEIRQNSENNFIYFEFEAIQFDIISQTATLNSATDFSMAINFNDQYYYTRAYVENADGTWTEIRTTHTDELYDVNVPTAVLKVINNSAVTVGTTSTTLGGVVNISIPQIYTGTGLLNSGVRFDVYETKGPLNMILWEYPFTAYTATWLAIDSNDNNVYAAPLNTFNTIIPFSTSVVSGGSNAVSFSDLRKQVITNAVGSASLPITNAQMTTALAVDGYTIVTNIDNITNRVFLATKPMPAPINSTLITPAASSIVTLNVTVEALIQIQTVINNSAVGSGSSVTITPDTIYQNVNGVVSPLSTNELTTLLGQSKSALALAVTNGNYLYTPFHYVLDMTNNEFNVRPYYLDNPTIPTQLFVSTNDTTLVQVNTGTYSIYRTANGYTITVVTISSKEYQALADYEVQAQLSFIPHGQNTPAYLTGSFMGTTSEGERIFSFDVSTNFNVDSNDCLQLTKFMLFANQPMLTGAKLLTNFNIIYTTTASIGSQWVANSIDKMLGNFLLPPKVIGITHEILRVNFGYALTRLWARSRSVVSTTEYQKWQVDVARIYDNDVYAMDVNASVIQFDAAGNPVLNLHHKKGDLVLDTNGDIIYRHRIGDVMFDKYGDPIIANPKGMMRQFDIMLIEGAYWFANDTTAANYRTVLNQNLLQWLTVDLVNIESQLLEQTDIYFYPNATLGTLQARVDTGVIVNIDASQSFTVDIYVSQVVYDDSALRSQLTTSTISTISKQLTKTTFSIDTITTALREVYGNDVISMHVSGLGGKSNYSVITILDSSKNCSIKKELVATADNSLIVAENVVVSFILYKVPNS